MPHFSKLDPIVALEEFVTALPDGFPDHAHRGFETLTYILPHSPGALTHEDMLGHAGTLRPGDAQRMTCGRGIAHSEVPESKYFAHGLQLWLNLANEDKMIEPSYQELRRQEQCRAEVAGVRAVVVAGAALGFQSTLRVRTPCHFVHFTMEPDSELYHPVPAGYTALVYTLAGRASYGGREANAHALVFFSSGEDEGGLVVSTRDSEASFVFVAGEPIGEPVVREGPFVMCTKEQIREAMLDYQLGRNGFELAGLWSSRNRLSMR